jgi:hypothetical protein
MRGSRPRLEHEDPGREPSMYIGIGTVVIILIIVIVILLLRGRV